MGCKFINIGDGSSAIICGHKDHVCDEKGPIVYDFGGDLMTLHDKLKEIKAGPMILQSCDNDKINYLIEHDIPINGSSVSCSICGASFQFLTEHWL